MAVLIPTPSLL